jgi:hypothetical protein
MDVYPEVLLPRKDYPNLLNNEDVLLYNFVRETEEDIYSLLDPDTPLEEVIKKIIAPQHKNEVFEFSVNLYGIYDESHVGIRASDEFNTTWNNDMSDLSANDVHHFKKDFYPLYLMIEKLYQQQICLLNTQGKEVHNYMLSFSHKPLRANYWHFQLYTKDTDTGLCISRNKTNSRIKHLAKHILEQYVVRAICQKTEVTKFRLSS